MNFVQAFEHLLKEKNVGIRLQYWDRDCYIYMHRKTLYSSGNSFPDNECKVHELFNEKWEVMDLIQE